MYSRYPWNGHVGCFSKRFNSQFPWSVRPSPIFQFAFSLINKRKQRLSLSSDVELRFTLMERKGKIPYLQWLERQGKPSKKWERSASCIGAQTTSCFDRKRTSPWRIYYRMMITRTARDWNEPVRTCRIIRYQQIVNSTFTKMSYLAGDAYKWRGGGCSAEGKWPV